MELIQSVLYLFSHGILTEERSVKRASGFLILKGFSPVIPTTKSFSKISEEISQGFLDEFYFRTFSDISKKSKVFPKEHLMKFLQTFLQEFLKVFFLGFPKTFLLGY